MEALSAVAGAVGIGGVVIQTISHLRSDIEAIQDAPADILFLKGELQELERLLSILSTHIRDSSHRALTTEAREGLKDALERCGNACSIFRDRVKKWTERSTEGSLHWVDRIYIGTLGQNKLQILIGRLETCKSAIDISINTAIFVVSTRSAEINYGIHDKVMTMDRKINQSLMSLEDNQIALNMQITEYQKLQYEDEKHSISSPWTQIIDEAEAAKEANEEFKKSLEAQKQGIQQLMGNVKATNAHVGIFNENKTGPWIQKMGDVVANGSVIGIARGVDFSSLRETTK
ncbi:hypothetical protein B0J11DRAFT_595581 [Dendryphion nanum]|uniref:Azaphilone pigments biosynthesis cluster protein L N-terminal domain-containing protein n=1 Tax=Dendryphion nanum TaxID=256645 RepID=A0A9P9IB64_9PLEO|nr:hypothetical protein B0J11DRAFT_595581 [Dendryphion nanum]